MITTDNQTDVAGVLIGTAAATLQIESEALAALRGRVGDALVAAGQLILEARGRVIAFGVGKSGVAAHKLASTLASTGTPAYSLSPTEALHGDLGGVTSDDVVVIVSNSGETSELLALLPCLRRQGVPVIAICGRADSTIARAAAAVLDSSVETEACPLGLAPTASVVTALAWGDALAMAVMAARGFTPEDFAFTHPGGSLGRRLLLRVEDLMHAGPDNPTLPAGSTVLDALLVMTSSSIRGAVSVVDEEGKLVGLFTDGDFRVLMQRHQDWASVMQMPIAEVMTCSPISVEPDERVMDAARVMEERKIDNLPVVDAQGHSMGMLDIQDIIASGLL